MLRFQVVLDYGDSFCLYIYLLSFLNNQIATVFHYQNSILRLESCCNDVNATTKVIFFTTSLLYIILNATTGYHFSNVSFGSHKMIVMYNFSTILGQN